MGFAMSPSHKDTNGTVNGFHTGSSVYLITWEAGRSRTRTDSLAPIRDRCEDGQTLSLASNFGSQCSCGPFGGIYMTGAAQAAPYCQLDESKSLEMPPPQPRQAPFTYLGPMD